MTERRVELGRRYGNSLSQFLPQRLKLLDQLLDARIGGGFRWRHLECFDAGGERRMCLALMGELFDALGEE